MHRLCFTLFAILLLLVSNASATPRLGTNLGGIVDWSTQRPFTNLFKQARPWIAQCTDERDSDCNGRWETGESNKLELDENGWVKSLPAPEEPGYSIAGTVLHVPNSFPAGRYLLLYEGEGTLRYNLGVQKIETESSNGRDVLNIDITRGLIHIQLLATDPNNTGNYIRNVRLIREADENIYQTQTFNPDFIARIQYFGALRFMDWMATNANDTALWSERRTPNYATYATYGKNVGAPAEVMVELANQLNVAPWFTMPHQADDNYLLQFATLVRDSLDTELPIYVEYSNELWNTQFTQHAWVREQSRNLWPGQANDFQRVINWYGKRTAEMCSIWKTAFGEDAGRVICVLGSQASNTWTASQALECPLWTDNPQTSCADHGIDALAIAPYFGGYLGSWDEQERIQDWLQEADGGLHSLFNELRTVALPQSLQWVTESKNVADNHSLQLLTYEAGQHLVGHGGVEHNIATTNFFIAANRDARMGQLYLDYFNGWEALGGGLSMNFADIGIPSQWGSWGALEHVLQTTSPKYDALLDYLNGDEYEAIVSMNASTANISEPGGQITLVATLDKAVTDDITVNLTFSGAATQDTDYQVSANSITIAAGTTSGAITLHVLDDNLIERNESVAISVGSLQGAARTIGTSLKISIDDVDTDGDSITDDWENHFDLNPNDANDAALDTDNDGETNLKEFNNNTDPTYDDSTKPRLGTNLNGVTDWSSQLPFIDLFKQSRSWITQCEFYGETPDPGCTGQWDTQEQALLDLDDNGWVRSIPKPADDPIFTRVTTYWAMYPQYQGGRHVVLYEGEGTMTYGFSANLVSSAPGRDVIDIVPNAEASIILTIWDTDPDQTGNYIRNTRIVPEAYAEQFSTPDNSTPVFNPDFLDRIRPFQSLRFMDWMDTNGSNITRWDDRPEIADAHYTTHGVPLELMLKLSNELDSDPWFTMPHQADDDYIRRSAELVRDQLKAGSRVYVEYSNEVWNTIFSQSRYALTQGQTLWPNAIEDEHTIRMNWFGKRTAEMCQIWKQTFGNDAHRVSCVLGTHGASWQGSSATTSLDCPLWADGPCVDYGIDAVAIAPYFGGHLGSQEVIDEITPWLSDADGGLDKLFTELADGNLLSNSSGSAIAEVLPWINNHRQIANDHGLQLLAYEGGQHIANIFGVLGNGIDNLFANANRDPRMGQFYTEYLQAWSEAGGDLFMNFIDISTPGRHGSWGALEYVEQTTSPKYDALLAYLSGNNPDQDFDGVPNEQDTFPDDPSESVDTDGDNIGNNADSDDDGDGADDTWEIANNFDPLDASDASGDADNDGLTNRQEFELGTNPRSQDSDNDGVNDGDEIKAGTDPNDRTDSPLSKAGVKALPLILDMLLND